MKSIKLFTRLIVACFVMVLGLLISTNSIYASSNKPTLNKEVVYCFVQPNNGSLYPVSLPTGSKVTKVSSSNKSVIKIQTDKNYKDPVWGHYDTNYFVHGEGTTTITYTVKYNKKTYTLKQKFVCKKKCPFNKLTVNGKNRLKEAKTNAHFISTKSKNNTIKWSISKDYKFNKAFFLLSTKGASKTGCTVNLKNKTDIEVIEVYLTDKKGHKFERYLLFLSL